VPSSPEILKERLIQRQNEEKFEILKRLEDAKKEMEEIQMYDYIIINDSLDEALENLTGVVLAERCKKDRLLELIKSHS
jgi:guanylate kinase